MKQIFAGIVLVGGLIAASLFYFNPFETANNHLSIYQAIPQQTGIVLETTQLSSFIDKIDSSNYASNFTQATSYQQLKTLENQVQKITSLLPTNEEVILEKQLIALSHIGNTDLGFLFIMELNTAVSFTTADLQNIFGLDNARVSEYNFDGQPIFVLEGFEEQAPFSFTIHDNLIIGSFHSPLVEESIQTLHADEHYLTTTDFVQLIEQNKSLADIQIYLQFKNIKTLSPVLLETEYATIFDNMNQQGDWARLDIKLAESSILWNGFATASQDSTSISVQLSHSFPIENTLADVLPNNTAYFSSTQFSDTAFFSNPTYEDAYWTSWINEHYAFFCLETFDENFEKRAGLVLEATDIEIAKANLVEYNNWDSPVETISNHPIYKSEMALPTFFQSNALPISTPYITFIGTHVYVANDIATLKTCIQKIENGNILSRDANFIEKTSNASTKSNCFTYSNPKKWAKSLSSVFTNYATQSSGFYHQVSHINGQFYLSGALDFGKSSVASNDALWSFALDTSSSFTPQIVSNHNNGTKEILAQDDKNQLYLINSSGETLFKIELDGQILGAIFQVDYYGNSKLQYIFNTEEKIYIIDRLGNSVADFPLNIPTGASAGLLVADYNNTNAYRVFVPTKNEKIYGYELDGTPLSGWSPKSDVGLITIPLSHHNMNDKDFLYTSNTKGEFLAFARNGDLRFSTTTNSDIKTSFQALKDGFVNGVDGKVYKVTEKGELQSTKIIDENADLYNYVYSHKNDKQASAFCSEKDFLYAKNVSNQFAKYKFEAAIIDLDYVESPKTLFVARSENQLHVIDETGNLLDGFPKSDIATARVLKLYNEKEPVLLIIDKSGKLSVQEINW